MASVYHCEHEDKPLNFAIPYFEATPYWLHTDIAHLYALIAYSLYLGELCTFQPLAVTSP